MSERPSHQLSGRIKSYKSGNAVTIEGFANAATVDRGKELIDPKAFTKDNGLNNFMKNPTILFDHGFDPNVGGLPIGKAVEVTPTDNGLFVKIKISQSENAPISTIRDLIEEGNLRAFSVGFNPTEIDQPNDKGVTVIKAAELFEVSVVGLPMNQDSLFQLSSSPSKDGRKRCVKSISQIKSIIAENKGSNFAAKVNLALDEPEVNRKSLIEQIASKAHVSEYTVYDMLNGDLDSTPNNLKHAVNDILQVKFEDPKDDEDKPDDEENKEKNDKATKVTCKGSGDNDHTHQASFDNETGDGETTSTDGDGPDHKHSIKEFQVQAGGEDSHTHPSLKSVEDKPKEDDEDKDDEDKDDGESKEKKDFQECVNEKIPKLIEEGKDQDEAVAIAIDFCRDNNKCTIVPDRAMYERFFAIAEGKIKQAEQGTDDITTPIDTSNGPGVEEQPIIEQQKQTNVLMGSLINEFKLFRDSLSGMTDELSSALRSLIGALNEKGADTDDGGNEDDSSSGTIESSEMEKRVQRTKNHLEKLNKRLKDLGAD